MRKNDFHIFAFLVFLFAGISFIYHADPVYAAKEIENTEEMLVGIGADRSYVSFPAPFDIKVRFDGKYETLTTDMTANWRREKNGNYIWNDVLVSKFFEELKTRYDTPPGSSVRFTTHSGKTMYIKSDNCNWQLNVEMSVSQFEQAVDNGEEEVDPAWNSGLVYSAESGVGTSYLEVSLSEQKVFLFEEGKLTYQTNCVTGNADGINDTLPGVFQVPYKASPSVLKGEDAWDNKYEQEVQYWIPFNGGQGFHDAIWRNEFGGEIYLSRGSHGCVNLPLEAAKKIYESVYTYFPVVVY